MSLFVKSCEASEISLISPSIAFNLATSSGLVISSCPISVIFELTRSMNSGVYREALVYVDNFFVALSRISKKSLSTFC